MNIPDDFLSGGRPVIFGPARIRTATSTMVRQRLLDRHQDRFPPNRVFPPAGYAGTYVPAVVDFFDSPHPAVLSCPEHGALSGALSTKIRRPEDIDFCYTIVAPENLARFNLTPDDIETFAAGELTLTVTDIYDTGRHADTIREHITSLWRPVAPPTAAVAAVGNAAEEAAGAAGAADEEDARRAYKAAAVAEAVAHPDILFVDVTVTAGDHPVPARVVARTIAASHFQPTVNYAYTGTHPLGALAPGASAHATVALLAIDPDAIGTIATDEEIDTIKHTRRTTWLGEGEHYMDPTSGVSIVKDED